MPTRQLSPCLHFSCHHAYTSLVTMPTLQFILDRIQK